MPCGLASSWTASLRIPAVLLLHHVLDEEFALQEAGGAVRDLPQPLIERQLALVFRLLLGCLHARRFRSLADILGAWPGRARLHRGGGLADIPGLRALLLQTRQRRCGSRIALRLVG